MNKLSENEIRSYIFGKIFNDNNYEVFPQLKECFDDDPVAIDNIFDEFITDLYDLSKPVVRPFLDERLTYIYRKTYGILDNGSLQTKVSVGKEFDMTGERVGQLIKIANRNIINMLVVDYNSYKNGVSFKEIPIDQLGVSTRVYFLLKRNGINFVSDINMEKLVNINSFGEKACEEIERGLVRVRKNNSNK